MIQIICDKCGAAIHLATEITLETDLRALGDKMKYELCPGCTEDLREWMTAR